MNDQITTFLQKPWVIPAVVGLVSFPTGMGLGYILGKRKSTFLEGELESYETPTHQLNLFEDVVDAADPPGLSTATQEAIEEAREAFHPFDDYQLDVEAIQMIAEDELEEAIAEEPVIKNIFAHDDEDWDYEHELSTRTKENPYILHVEEYVAEEMGFDQKTAVYYDGDQIMADEENTPIYGFAAMMGDLNFGHGSKDPTLVYIRNEVLETEWEVILVNGHFAIEVLGNSIEQEYADAELKHSNSPHKFREE